MVFAGHCATLNNRTNNQGATSYTGIKEHVYNDGMVERLERECTAVNYVTIPAKLDIPLTSRPRLAARAGAHALISIHHDSIQQSDLDSMKDASAEDPSWQRFSGFSLWVAKTDNYDGSLKLASLIADQLMEIGLKPSLYHAQDTPGEGRKLIDKERGIYSRELFVTKNATVPAVLMEVGYLINPNEEAVLSQDSFRTRFTTALNRAIEKFFDDEETGTGGRF